MSQFSNLIAYFNNLASTHKSILHTEQEKHFFRMEVDEVLAGINRTDVAYPLFVLEGYSYGFTDFNSDNLLKKRQGGFILLDHISDMSDFDAIHETWDALEEIGDEILVKIKMDKRSPLTKVVRDFDISSVEATLIMNQVANTVGIRYLFSISSPTSNETDPTKWL